MQEVVYKIFILIFSIILLFLPVILAERHRKNTRKKLSASEQIENTFIVPQDCWFFRLRGVVETIIILLLIILMAFYVQMVTGNYGVQKVSLQEFIVCISILMFLICASAVHNYLEHRGDFFSISSEGIRFKNGHRVVSLSKNEIVHVKPTNRKFIFNLQNKKRIELNRKYLLAFIRGEELIGKIVNVYCEKT